ncbi:MAG: toxin-antitoxin system protein [Gammaproteobacteria bacterium]|nr:MAG: toxin-antitoxin system protein [Gammaproteobacteria bacterium]
MQESQVKNAAINIRALPTQRSLIDRAAILQHKTRSDFMLEAACREAENVLLDQHLFSLDEIQFEAFQEMLDAPLNDNNLIQALLVSVSPWEK